MMKLTSICSVLCLLVFLGCNNEAPKEASALSLEELGEQFIVAANAGDLTAIDSLYTTQEEFAATFSGDGIDALYQTIRTAFDTSISQILPNLKEAKYVRMNMDFCPEPIQTEPGMDFGAAAFKISTLATDHMHVIADINGQTYDVKLDSLIKLGDTWRLLSPIGPISECEVRNN
jgi:hypothetical protein